MKKTIRMGDLRDIDGVADHLRDIVEWKTCSSRADITTSLSTPKNAHLASHLRQAAAPVYLQHVGIFEQSG